MPRSRLLQYYNEDGLNAGGTLLRHYGQAMVNINQQKKNNELTEKFFAQLQCGPKLKS